jgi:hypothetical protein
MLHLISLLGTRTAPRWIAAIALAIIAGDAIYLGVSGLTSREGSLVLLALLAACIVTTHSLLRTPSGEGAAPPPNGRCDFRLKSLAFADDAGPLHRSGGSVVKQLVSRRATKLFGTAFAIAAAAFWVTMLTSPPKTVASMNQSAGLTISAIAIPANLPLGGPWDTH